MCCTYWCTACESKISLTYLQYIQFFSSCCSAVWKCEKLCATDGRWHAHFPSVCFLPLLILESTIPAKSLSVEKDCLALGNSGTKMPVFCLPNWFTINFKNSWINSLSSERGKELVWNCQLEIQWFGNSEFQNESHFLRKILQVLFSRRMHTAYPSCSCDVSSELCDMRWKEWQVSRLELSAGNSLLPWDPAGWLQLPRTSTR